MASTQTWTCRKPYMEKMVKLETSNSKGDYYKILEIGSWAGDSAILWAEGIKKFNNGKGLIICIDPWKPYLEHGKKSRTSNVIVSRMEKALKSKKIYGLFHHNITTSKHDDIIKPYRGCSDELLPTLGDNQFNLIFVDGSHSYSQVIKDLKNCERLLCKGGVLCGDDLELQKHEIDVKNAERSKDKDDCILDERTNTYFHPGVTLAIGDFFGEEIPSFEGFWGMRKTTSGWQKVELT